MAMSIHFNQAGFGAQSALTQSSEKMGVAMQRLTSGLRVNSSKDDRI